MHGRPTRALAALESMSDSLGDGASVRRKLGQHVVLVIGDLSADRAADTIARDLSGAEAVLVTGVGLFAWGDDLGSAVRQLEILENAAGTELPVAPVPGNDMRNLAAQLASRVTRAMAAQGANTAPSLSPSTPGAQDSCNGCGRCTNRGGSLPSARQQVASDALNRLSDAELVALIAEATREVLEEKGLI